MGTSELVQVAELAEQLRGAAPPTLLDVRWSLGGPPGELAYREGHLPGAVYVDLDTALAAPPGAGGRHPLPAPADFGASMRAAGVSQDRPVVVYDGGDCMAAARAWWCLAYYGHRQVRVLDGGYQAWVAAGEPVSTEPPAPSTGDFEARPGGLELVDADEAAAVARAGVLLDVRTGERYRGETEAVDPVAGHIPGAVSAPTADNSGPDGRFLDAEALRDRFDALGVTGDTQVGAYCGSGVSAAHTVLALRLAGVPAALYVGSWSDWITDSTRPVSVGEKPG
ncbi:MAG: sulfurtransferase [Streptosporangiales bacterium]|nr:sulfurtransferase [Streptosporangiales bacterium]